MKWDKMKLSASALPWLALLLLVSAGRAARAEEIGTSLRAGSARLTLAPISPGRFGVRVAASGVWAQDAPLAVEVVDAHGTAAWLTGAYESITPSGGELVCAGTLQTPAGTQFRFTDTYAPLPGITAFALTRHVEIATPHPEDKGFSSRFSLSPARATAMADCDFFAPGVWSH